MYIYIRFIIKIKFSFSIYIHIFVIVEKRNIYIIIFPKFSHIFLGYMIREQKFRENINKKSNTHLTSKNFENFFEVEK